MNIHTPLASRWLFGLMILFCCSAFGLVGCGDEDPAANGPIACSNDDPCPLGQVCLKAKGTCGAVSCDFCLPGQICFDDGKGNKSCSKPECFGPEDCTAPESCIDGICTESSCTTKDDCPAGKICNLASQCVDPPEKCGNDNECPSGEVCKTDTGICLAGCSDDTACPATQYCNQDSKSCVDGCRDDSSCESFQSCSADNQCACDNSKCTNGQMCDPSTNKCADNPITSCDEVTCQPGFYCNANNGFQCEQGCVPEAGQPTSCPTGEVCNTATGQCITDSCPGEDPNQCNGTNRPIWDPNKCACVQCSTANDCPNAGDTCNANGECTAGCATMCDSNTPGTCQGATPYCVSGCCRQCITAADCANPGDLCIDGTCGAEPDCTLDPTVCPQGWSCENGSCKEPAGGGNCDVQNPASCPSGQFCQPTSMGSSMGTCQGLGGGGMCGLCEAGCTCPGSMTCDGFACTGCSGFIDPDCLSIGGFCLQGLCLKLGL